MSKHPGPWALIEGNGHVRIVDNAPSPEGICDVTTRDPETRAVLLHAAEMWEEFKRSAEVNGTYDIRWARAVDICRKIEAEIAEERKT